MHNDRKPPQEAPPPVKTHPGLIRQVRTYRLITPLFGGGAEPQKPDEVTVVRASEIRGILRFWWRAIRGGRYPTIEKLRQAEDAIWGSAAGKEKSGPSPVSLEVRVLQRGRKRHEVQIPTRNGPKRYPFGDPRSPYGYVAFPLRDSGNGVQDGVEFALYITIRDTSVQAGGKTLDVVEEVEAAVWAWETFGGVGARTRRGFGALELVKVEENGEEKSVDRLPASPSQVKSWIMDRLGRYVAGDYRLSDVPHLSRQPLLEVLPQTFRDGESAWKALIIKLQEFRQKRHKRFGLSLWPEANVIRKIHGLPMKWPPGILNPQFVEKFPRARFGLPIIFPMPHDKRLKNMDILLYGQASKDNDKHLDRLASPLILRPLACQEGYVGLALVLEGPKEPPGGLLLETDGKTHPIRADLTQQEASQEPLRRILHGEPDVLKAFLKTLKNS
ncbi:MAG: type III-B CRISPR module RAMP protein Cmr1 [Candidatus Hydrothermae bacterium]|nr:type III-B CRISPR module RAMP protein Cmr1 [Candidatus Hydrothermae bacterium]